MLVRPFGGSILYGRVLALSRRRNPVPAAGKPAVRAPVHEGPVYDPVDFPAAARTRQTLMDTVTLTIDGRQVTVAKGRSVLQAAIEAGIKVPYYCYHPALGVDGSCRVCLVKIEKMPKLQVSCSVTAADGMVVHTATQEVEDARAGVFEFLLLNHPLDCPVCDKGGECPLQDFSYAFGRDDSRMEFPRRTFDGDGVKADVDFGPTLMLNRNRCILCTRCVRFMQDIDGDAQIGIMNRGNGSEIATFEEHGVHSLLSGNLMDVCPVGAITTRDYRFKSRPWDNPERRRHDLHALREGLQHDDVAPRQARVGQGRAAGARHAAPQRGGQRLLDVRHRPLRLPLDRVGRAPDAADGARRRRAGADAVGHRDRGRGQGAEDRRGRRAGPALPALGARLARRALRRRRASRSTSSATPRRTPSTSPGPAAPSRSLPASKFIVPTVDAPNVGGARLLGLTSAARR